MALIPTGRKVNGYDVYATDDGVPLYRHPNGSFMAYDGAATRVVMQPTGRQINGYDVLAGPDGTPVYFHPGTGEVRQLGANGSTAPITSSAPFQVAPAPAPAAPVVPPQEQPAPTPGAAAPVVFPGAGSGAVPGRPDAATGTGRFLAGLSGTDLDTSISQDNLPGVLERLISNYEKGAGGRFNSFTRSALGETGDQVQRLNTLRTLLDPNGTGATGAGAEALAGGLGVRMTGADPYAAGAGRGILDQVYAGLGADPRARDVYAKTSLTDQTADVLAGIQGSWAPALRRAVRDALREHSAQYSVVDTGRAPGQTGTFLDYAKELGWF